jgi:hypothetical protein
VTPSESRPEHQPSAKKIDMCAIQVFNQPINQSTNQSINSGHKTLTVAGNANTFAAIVEVFDSRTGCQ